jgi:hypothetical protein
MQASEKERGMSVETIGLILDISLVASIGFWAPWAMMHTAPPHRSAVATEPVQQPAFAWGLVPV